MYFRVSYPCEYVGKKVMNVDFVKIPFKFKTEKLESALSACIDNNISIRGNWQSISLRSHFRKETDAFFNRAMELEYQDTPLLESCKYLKEVLNSFQCELESVRLLRLTPGNFIYENCKQDFRYEDGFLRLHIPIQTNTKVSHRINDRLIFMNPGECWYVNMNVPHSVCNNGTTDRIHLVIDAKRNEWTDSLFLEPQTTHVPTPKSSKKKKELEYVYR